MKNILFDSYAILTFYQDEKGAEAVEQLLASSEASEIQSFISEINLGEIYYQIIRRKGIEFAKNQMEQFAMLSVPDHSPFVRDHYVRRGNQGRLCHLIRGLFCRSNGHALFSLNRDG